MPSAFQNPSAIAGLRADGWIDDTQETWSFATSTTFTVPGDATAKYTVGTRITLAQSGSVKYFVVSANPVFSSGTTTVTITGGSDYTLANATITANYHSYMANPQGYPGWFNYTPTWSGVSASPSGNGRFAVDGRRCTLVISPTGNGTSNATTKSVTAPIAISASGLQFTDVWAACRDASADQTTPSHCYFGTLGSTTITLSRDGQGNPWTASGTWIVRFVMHYEI